MQQHSHTRALRQLHINSRNSGRGLTKQQVQKERADKLRQVVDDLERDGGQEQAGGWSANRRESVTSERHEILSLSQMLRHRKPFATCCSQSLQTPPDLAGGKEVLPNRTL